MVSLGSVRLKAWLKDRGVQKKWVAEKVGVSASLISKTLAGEYVPGLRMALKVEELCGIRTEEWLRRVESDEPGMRGTG